VKFESFLDAELAGLAAFAGAVAGDKELAEDVLADALLAVTLRWTRVSRMENPAAYVRRVVVTTFLSDRRKATRRRTDPTDDPTKFDQSHSDAVERVDQRDEVTRLLLRLAPQQRAALFLRYIMDQTDQEIADALGCSAGTVRSHLSLGREALRAATTSVPQGGPADGS
jgi:RNA polymerase sigma factor (sigma-70 family)